MNASLKGLLSENAAVSELIARNFNVAKPVVDIYGYDFIVYKNDKYNKVQVRSSHTISQNCYKFHCNHGSYANIPYKKDMVDFFIFHLVDVNAWFVVPFDDISTTSVCITLNETNKYNKYRDAWHLLMEE